MTYQPRQSNAAANAAANAVTVLLNSGYLRIYNGTQPVTCDTAISGQTLLAELIFNATAFGSASAGVATANAITSDASANATGTATWFRALKSDGTSAIFDGAVDIATSDLVISTVSIVSGNTVAVTSLLYTQSKN